MKQGIADSDKRVTKATCCISEKPLLRTNSRRALLTAVGAAALLPGLAIAAHTHDDVRIPIPQPADPTPAAFIERAFAMRQAAVDKGDQAYGAVIVRDRVIIGQSWSRVILDSDPTAHAEMAAIRNAAWWQRDSGLRGTVMYSSSRPCPMCEAAAYWAGIGEMIHGRSMTSAGAPVLCR